MERLKKMSDNISRFALMGLTLMETGFGFGVNNRPYGSLICSKDEIVGTYIAPEEGTLVGRNIHRRTDCTLYLGGIYDPVLKDGQVCDPSQVETKLVFIGVGEKPQVVRVCLFRKTLIPD